ncbi:MAG: MarR family transcriptional regulator [Armatimonadota bacterium]|nr:MarR family transcriptional regulator [Armatimonadota bacterium]MDR5703097.1 MarR family transcriptional regulator [Armatimonadota bacterium]
MDRERLAQQLIEATHLFLRNLCVEVRADMAEGFPFPYYRLIGMLAKHPWTLKDLANAQRVSAPTISRAVRVLEERKLVVCERDRSDRRRVWIRLTAKGRAEYRRLQAHAVMGAGRLLARLTPGERKKLQEVLPLLYKMAEPRGAKDERD